MHLLAPLSIFNLSKCKPSSKVSYAEISARHVRYAMCYANKALITNVLYYLNYNYELPVIINLLHYKD